MNSYFKLRESYHDSIYRLYGSDKYGIDLCRSVTFVVTEDCCLNCTYCYETHKTKKKMSIETAKQIVDYLFELYDKDDKNLPINKNTQSIVLEFIGGEPLLEINLIMETCDYFWAKAIEKHSPWALLFRIAISTNGVLYFEPKVQEFIRKYKRKLSMSVSLDGSKEMHDKCRLHFDGTGSWDEAHRAAEQIKTDIPFIKPGTKVTISPENMPYLFETIKFFLEDGYTEIYANPIYEHEWSHDESAEYYLQLKKIADMLFEGKYRDIVTNLFEESFFVPIPETDNGTWCGGSGDMIAFDTEGKAYPCLRYMEMSLNGEQKPLVIGDCYMGIYQSTCEKKLHDELRAVNRRSQCTDECYYCPIARGCASCTAWDYQSSGKLACKSTNICWMHKARSLANVYYWNTLYRNAGEKDKRMPLMLPKEDALKIVSEQEYENLKKLSE